MFNWLLIFICRRGDRLLYRPSDPWLLRVAHRNTFRRYTWMEVATATVVPCHRLLTLVRSSTTNQQEAHDRDRDLRPAVPHFERRYRLEGFPVDPLVWILSRRNTLLGLERKRMLVFLSVRSLICFLFFNSMKNGSCPVCVGVLNIE